MLQINVLGTFNMLRHAAAAMARQEALGEERGVCVLTASVAPDAARRRAQRGRLRDVGAGGQAGRQYRRGSWPGSTSRSRCVTTFTLGADDPEAMAEGARRYADAQAIKVKLTGELELDIERVERGPRSAAGRLARRRCQPGLRIETLDALVEVLRKHGVALLEQPLARGREADLDGYRSPDPDRRRRKRARPRRRRRRWSAASTSSTSSSTSAAASPRRC